MRTTRPRNLKETNTIPLLYWYIPVRTFTVENIEYVVKIWIDSRLQFSRNQKSKKQSNWFFNGMTQTDFLMELLKLIFWWNVSYLFIVLILFFDVYEHWKQYLYFHTSHEIIPFSIFDLLDIDLKQFKKTFRTLM